MRLRKILSVAVAAALVVMTFAACGNNEESNQTSITSDYSFADNVQNYMDKIDTKYAYNIAKTLAYDDKYFDNELGWRSAGSDAEHACSDYLMDKMTDLGLEDVTKDKVTVDKFQFNDSSLTVSGTKIDLMPASYQCSGTDKDGISAQIVNCGTGFESDYDGKDVKGKIVLVGVDQSNESWIDGYIRQADHEGAAAIVTYSVGGYGQLNDNTVNVQDICCADIIPTVAISRNQAKEIKKAIKNGNDEATLKVDSEFEPGQGTTYNVVGKIKGKSSDQQIIISGHYDKYWYGFQDDSCAIGLVLATAKAMIDSGYQPENDIVFVCHGSEEWGATNTQFDWTMGAWGEITKAHPEWVGKTLALFNCELPAYSDGTGEIGMTCVPEFSKFYKNFVQDSGLAVKAEGIDKIKYKSNDADTMEDGVSYRWAGVPYFINTFQGEKFMANRYHTSYDNKSTWNKATIKTNMNLYGAMAIYVDQMPALELDFTRTCSDLESALNDKYAEAAGADTQAYKDNLADLSTAAKAMDSKISDINEKYQKAVSDGDKDKAAKLREEGKTVNKQTLKCFKYIQKNLISTDTWGLHIKNVGINDNIKTLKTVIKGLDNKKLYAKDEKSGALDAAYNINAGIDYDYYIFSKDVADDMTVQYDPDRWTGKLFWCTDKLVPFVDVGSTTYDLVQKANAEETPDYDAAKKVYQSALDDCFSDLKTYLDDETGSMKELTKMVNAI